MAEVLLSNIVPLSPTVALMAFKVSTSVGSFTVPIEVEKGASVEDDEMICVAKLWVMFGEATNAADRHLSRYQLPLSAMMPFADPASDGEAPPRLRGQFDSSEIEPAKAPDKAPRLAVTTSRPLTPGKLPNWLSAHNIPKPPDLDSERTRELISAALLYPARMAEKDVRELGAAVLTHLVRTVKV